MSMLAGIKARFDTQMTSVANEITGLLDHNKKARGSPSSKAQDISGGTVHPPFNEAQASLVVRAISVAVQGGMNSVAERMGVQAEKIEGLEVLTKKVETVATRHSL